MVASSGTSRSSFPRKRERDYVIPAKAGIQVVTQARQRSEIGPRPAPGRRNGSLFPRKRESSGVIAKSLGFSLLEVLVAFIILALVGTALFELFGGALNNASAADEYSRAALFGESRLTAAAVETPLREGGDQGVSEDGKFAWATRIEPYVAPGTTADEDRLGQLAAVRLWRISVIVSWPGTLGNQRSVSLATVRLAPKQP
jgi:general secretion pathway protein I